MHDLAPRFDDPNDGLDRYLLFNAEQLRAPAGLLGFG